MSHAAPGLVERVWYGDSPWSRVLAPLSALFALAAAVRRALYRRGVLRVVDVGRPVFVVGNLTAGGTGKTPIAMWLAAQLKERGRRPGIVSRGYRARVGPHPVRVTVDSDPAEVGDEPLLMERRRICPVVVHPDRVAAAKLLVEMDCDVIVSDDGLQHYRLHRDYEIVLVDGRRGLGNGRRLPAGPLREDPERLAGVDYILVQREAEGGPPPPIEWPDGVPREAFELAAGPVCNLAGAGETTLSAFRGRTVHAVAGIGHPGRFFRLLEAGGIVVIPHARPDHAKLSADALDFGDGLDVLMTEKDAMRLTGAAPPHCWYLRVDPRFDGPGPAGWLDRILRVPDPQPRSAA